MGCPEYRARLERYLSGDWTGKNRPLSYRSELLFRVANRSATAPDEDPRRQSGDADAEPQRAEDRGRPRT